MKNTQKQFITGLVIVFLVLNSCTRSNVDKNGYTELKMKLNGVWTHSVKTNGPEIIEETFSWGSQEVDYYNDMVIDINNTNTVLAYADGGWTSIDIESWNGKIAILRLKKKEAPAPERIQIEFESETYIYLKTLDGEKTSYSNMFEGRYYKKVNK
jgi:hypothetical protein